MGDRPLLFVLVGVILFTLAGCFPQGQKDSGQTTAPQYKKPLAVGADEKWGRARFHGAAVGSQKHLTDYTTVGQDVIEDFPDDELNCLYLTSNSYLDSDDPAKTQYKFYIYNGSQEELQSVTMRVKLYQPLQNGEHEYWHDMVLTQFRDLTDSLTGTLPPLRFVESFIDVPTDFDPRYGMSMEARVLSATYFKKIKSFNDFGHRWAFIRTSTDRELLNQFSTHPEWRNPHDFGQEFPNAIAVMQEHPIAIAQLFGLDEVPASYKDGVPLMYFVGGADRDDCVDYIVGERHLPVDSDYGGVRPISSAARTGNVSIVKALIKHGANPNRIDSDWEAPIAMGFRPNLADVKALIAAGMDPNVMSENGKSAMHDLATDGNLPDIVVAARKGFNPNLTNGKYGSPYFSAIDADNINTLRGLFEVKADITSRNGRGETPFDYAIRTKHDFLAENLKEYAAESKIDAYTSYRPYRR